MATETLTIPNAAVAALRNASLSEEQARAYYEAHQNDYFSPVR